MPRSADSQTHATATGFFDRPNLRRFRQLFVVVKKRSHPNFFALFVDCVRVDLRFVGAEVVQFTRRPAHPPNVARRRFRHHFVGRPR